MEERRREKFRVRRALVLFYLEDDTVQVNEPQETNSGIPQGDNYPSVYCATVFIVVVCCLLFGILYPSFLFCFYFCYCFLLFVVCSLIWSLHLLWCAVFVFLFIVSQGGCYICFVVVCCLLLFVVAIYLLFPEVIVTFPVVLLLFVVVCCNLFVSQGGHYISCCFCCCLLLVICLLFVICLLLFIVVICLLLPKVVHTPLQGLFCLLLFVVLH